MSGGHVSEVAYLEDAWDIFPIGMNDIRFLDRAHLKLFVPVIQVFCMSTRGLVLHVNMPLASNRHSVHSMASFQNKATAYGVRDTFKIIGTTTVTTAMVKEADIW